MMGPVMRNLSYTSPKEILWERGEKGIRILRVYGNDLDVRLPSRIGGEPVTEIGAYCFSGPEHLPESGYHLTVIDENDMETMRDHPLYPSVSGSYVKMVRLPDTVTTLHNASFYNCRNISCLSLGRNLRSIGSDVFLNCNHLKNIIIRCSSAEQSGLSLLLERMTSDVEVCFCPEDNKTECVLFFPEYYEWLNEVTAAHSFTRSIEGEGFRMRHAFRDGRIDFSKYDQCFPDVLKGESGQNICRIALNRLRWPTGLTEDLRTIYKQSLRNRFPDILGYLGKHKDLEGLRFLCGTFSPSREQLSSWMQGFIAADWSEGTVYLMEEIHKHSSFAGKTFSFDEFDPL